MNKDSNKKFITIQPKGFVYFKTSLAKAKQERLVLLKSIKNQYESCMLCPLSQQGRTQVVFGVGNPCADLMFIGEAPGKDEDVQGSPFIGRAGKLLTSIIHAMGLSREDIYITNVVKCRPPQNRTPLPDERNTCKDALLMKEIALIKPKIVCTLGSPSTQALLGDSIKISEVRGKFYTIFNTIKLIPTFHPAYLLRNPEAKKIVWQDMKKIMTELDLIKNNR